MDSQGNNTLASQWNNTHLCQTVITYDQDRAMVGGWVGEGKVRESVLDLQRPVELVRTKWRPGYPANHVPFHCMQ